MLASALIIAGGRGTRFWPESRLKSPKPLFAVKDKESLLDATISRTLTLVPRERIFVLVSRDQRHAFSHAIRNVLPSSNLIVEPEGRGTAVAVAYGCGVIGERFGINTVVMATPADHYIAPTSSYKATLEAAISLADQHQKIVTIGIPPTRAEIGYGYMKVGRLEGEGFRIQRFVEKPTIRSARKMVRSGHFLWNAGIFVMSIAVLAAEFDNHAPLLGHALRQLPQLSAQRKASLYRTLEFDSFDRTVLEKDKDLLGIRATFAWHDVGSWEGLWDALRGTEDNVLIGNIIALESSGIIARTKSRLMVCFGIADVLAIDTGEILLIARRSRSQEIGAIVSELNSRGLRRYL